LGTVVRVGDTITLETPSGQVDVMVTSIAARYEMYTIRQGANVEPGPKEFRVDIDVSAV